MKKHLILFALSLISKTFLFSQTIVPGGAVSGLWAKVNSPYLIQGAIMVANSSTLVIEPGVRVEFQGSYKFLALGQILAIGTANDSITFTSNNPSVGWLGIRFDNTATTNDSSRFSNCIFEYGKANAASPGDQGGAFYFLNFSKVRISNSRISNCTAQGGGAIYYNCNPIISNNLIANNTATTCGAISCSGSSNISATICGNTFKNNSSTGSSYAYGGVIGTWGQEKIYNNTFINNSSLSTNYSGGAIYCGSSCMAQIHDNIFTNNSSPNFNGGAIFCYSSSPTIFNNVIVNNSAINGGGIYCDYGTPTLYNNTISNNQANYGGGIYLTSYSSPNIKNTIIWGNTATTGGNQIYLFDEYSDPNIFYSNIQGGQSAVTVNTNVFYLGTYTNNINSDPLFVSASAGSGNAFNGLSANWSLQSGSPCINLGDPNGSYPMYDVSGNPRVANGRIDMGAYEFSTITNLLNSKEKTDIAIYPNPSSGILKLNVDNEEILVLEIINLMGENILLQPKLLNKNSCEIDLTDLSNGIYSLKLLKEKTTIYKKIIIEK